ncbi:MAG TPA: prephenate dehydrogenase [Tepidisphaeraceae bacterium]|nr:prephenate dehydrogenase [Tepidisphaeraceae bacterium]
MIRAVTIVGVAGEFGRRFAERFAAMGLSVTGVDISPRPLAGDLLDHYIHCDAATANWHDLGAEEPHRLVLLCLPQQAVLSALPRLMPALAPDAIAADIVSVKSHIAHEFSRHNTTGQYVSLHPMFGPAMEWTGQRVASIALRDGPAVEHLEGMLDHWGMQITRMTADEHDRGAAVTQVMTHATLLALGSALQQSEVPPPVRDALTTPPYRVLQAMIARLTSGDPSLYRHIQHDNPHASDARALLADQFRTLAQACESEEAFADLMRRASPANRDQLAALSAKLAEISRERS